MGDDDKLRHPRHPPFGARRAGTKLAILDAYHMFTPYSFPNVVYVDMLGAPFRLPNGKTQDEYVAMTQGHMTAFATAVNLYIASENCNLGGRKIHS